MAIIVFQISLSLPFHVTDTCSWPVLKKKEITLLTGKILKFKSIHHFLVLSAKVVGYLGSKQAQSPQDSHITTASPVPPHKRQVSLQSSGLGSANLSARYSLVAH